MKLVNPLNKVVIEKAGNEFYSAACSCPFMSQTVMFNF